MLALAKLWTWIGNTFVPLAIGWAFYMRGGLTNPLPMGVLISRGYWGIVVTLIAGAGLVWTMALYVRLAKKNGALIVVPPNTAFEDDASRNRVISWGTVVVFAVAVLSALTVSGVRYTDSQIHKWDDQQPLQRDFWGSRARAYGLGCPQQPCFAVGQRTDSDGKPVFGVNEYILYVTDGALVIFGLLILGGICFLTKEISYHRPPIEFQQ
jgi:hypothetical protein